MVSSSIALAMGSEVAVIRVINPNSNQAVTDAIATGVQNFAVPGKIEIHCETLESGPFGIQTQRDIEQVVIPVVDRMKAREADAFVLACYSDPGLALARDELDVPVFGVMESAVHQAAVLGTKFGVIALSEAAIGRHIRALTSMQMIDRLAAERSLGVSVAESAGEEVFDAMLQTGRSLRDKDGAEVLILGCAGMARHRGPLAEALGIPVIDPSQAAVGDALAFLLPNQTP